MTGERNDPDWLAELARGGESLRRQVSPIVQAAKQFVDDARAAQARTGTPLPFAQRVALAMDASARSGIAAMRNERQGRVVITGAHQLVTVTQIAAADVIRVTEEARVVVLEDSGTATAELSTRDRIADAGKLLALVLVWVVAAGIAVAQQALPPEAQAKIANDYAVFSIALVITWRILDKYGR